MLRLVLVQFLPLPPPKHGEALAIPPTGTNLGPRDQMVVHMRYDLRRRRAVVLHHVPVGDARGAHQRRGQQADVAAQVARLRVGHVRQLGPVGARAEEQVAVTEGQDVEEGDERGRGEDDEGLRRREVRGEWVRGVDGGEGRVGGGDGAEGAVFFADRGRGERRVE